MAEIGGLTRLTGWDGWFLAGFCYRPCDWEQIFAFRGNRVQMPFRTPEIFPQTSYLVSLVIQVISFWMSISRYTIACQNLPD